MAISGRVCVRYGSYAAAGRSRLVDCNRLSGVIPLAADCPGEGTKDVIAASQPVQDVPEVEARLPREFLPSATIDIDTIDTREHSPTALTVHLLVVREQATNY